MATTVATQGPRPNRLRNALLTRQLDRYPKPLPRYGYLGIVVLTTIVLYYLYYVEGAITPLMLPYYHMSFQYFLYVLVVANAIGAFTAFIGGLSDKIGRANLTIYGTLIVGLVQLVGAAHPLEGRIRRRVLHHRIRRGRDPRLHPGADPRLLAAVGPRRGHGILGSRSDDGEPGREPGGQLVRFRTSGRGRTSSTSPASCAWSWS